MVASVDVYIILHLASTCDDHGISVGKDQCETIELAWKFLKVDKEKEEEKKEEEGKNEEEKEEDKEVVLRTIEQNSNSIKPINTPITPLCTSITGLSWDVVRQNGITLSEAINNLDKAIQDLIISQNLNFAFVVFNSWDIRVQLIRESRDKSVNLPDYLQYPKVFDLKNEYQLWQNHHPESLNYGSSNIMNVCNALNINMDELINKENENDDLVNKNYFIPKLGKDYLEISDLILKKFLKESKFLIQLLSKPFDIGHDIKIFIQEKSRVLYLSNLPYDTTQGELEAWFTRYGGRPIALRTLKTGEPHKYVGSGFAIFATHESAMESLAMNGRLLNDRSIEVEPSSFKVLDFAQEILVSFPPSKNKSRPGDWNCPSCGFCNFQRRTACLRCSFPAISAVTIQENLQLKSNNQGQGFQPNNNNINNTVNLSRTSSYNAGGNNGMLMNPLMNGSSISLNSNNSNNLNMNLSMNNNNTNTNTNNLNNNLNNNNNNLNNSNNNHNHNKAPGNSIPFRAGDWKCEKCYYHNFAKNVYCLRCGITRVNNNNLNAKIVSAASSMILPGMNQFSTTILNGIAKGNIKGNNGFQNYNNIYQPKPEGGNDDFVNLNWQMGQLNVGDKDKHKY